VVEMAIDYEAENRKYFEEQRLYSSFLYYLRSGVLNETSQKLIDDIKSVELSPYMNWYWFDARCPYLCFTALLKNPNVNKYPMHLDYIKYEDSDDYIFSKLFISNHHDEDEFRLNEPNSFLEKLNEKVFSMIKLQMLVTEIPSKPTYCQKCHSIMHLKECSVCSQEIVKKEFGFDSLQMGLKTGSVEEMREGYLESLRDDKYREDVFGYLLENNPEKKIYVEDVFNSWCKNKQS
jgi:hypothetical protein